jgi:myogenesis-regulating glycosidase
VRNAEAMPPVVTWWQGLGGLLDVSNLDALAWFKANLQHLQAATGLDGFKFDAGESTYLPHDAVTVEPMSGNEFTHRYIEFVGQHFPWSDVRAGWLNQQSALLPRQWDKASTWGLDNGLHSVITGGLALSLAGYALFLPDMIGGNAYVEQPDAELMIRWAQVNALMPGLQFSLAPWDYGPECEAICRKYAEMHKSLGPLFHSLAVEHTLTGKPIIRPLWWHSPHDEEALLCNDEFLLGDRYLAAPVVKLGLRTRDVYLPAGSWRDWREQVDYLGPLWLRDYPAPLDVLPLFESLK